MECFDISNKLPRLVMASRDGRTFKAGDVVFVERVEVHSWFTHLYIDGFPYNSCDFEELHDQPLKRALKLVKEGNAVRTISLLSQAVDVTFCLGGDVEVKIAGDKLAKMPLGGVITVGRNPQCTISGHLGGKHGNMIIPFDRCVSRMHMIVYRDGKQQWRVIDCSSFGTALML